MTLWRQRLAIFAFRSKSNQARLSPCQSLTESIVQEKYASLDDAFRSMIRVILDAGDRAAPRAIATTEVRAMCISIADPRRRYVSFAPRRWSFAYALGEFCWHIRGSDRLDEIAFYAAKWRDMSED